MSSIYSQSVEGKFRTIKDYFSYVLLFIYFGCSWIRWHREEGFPDQAILLDLPNRKAYLFAIQIWPEETYYIAGILILAALGLFFITSLFGRIWCGYGCPHTVFVDLFMKIEKYFQGDRNARLKLESQPYDKNKLIKKLSTHLVWVLVAFAFAFGWICYFYDSHALIKDIVTFNVSAEGFSWLMGLTISTYLFAGFVREKMCTYMCPYGRFQSAMLDNNSSLVTYHGWRGEPRGKFDPKNNELGDCIDCGKCVVVCPMGIDIRVGLQMQCIGCGLCVDACNTVMEKLDRRPNLIAYDSVNSTTAKSQGLNYHQKLFNFKTLLFCGIFIVVSMLMLYALINKPEISLTVIRDRDALFTILPDGSYRNQYNIKVFNKSTRIKKMTLSLAKLAGATLKINNVQNTYAEYLELTINPEEELELDIFIKLDDSNINLTGSTNFNLVLLENTGNKKYVQPATFFTAK